MIIDPQLGPVATDLGWVPAPRYLMRRARILAHLDTMPRGRLLEIGPGSGALLVEFANAGFACEALDSSEQARTRTQALLARSGHAIPVHARPDPGWAGRFDALCAFEVLEHIEDDLGALQAWRDWLRPGGSLLLSVPAHMRLWTARDEWAGHVRRYEKQPLHDVVARAGFRVDALECYGFPLTNLTEWVSQPLFRKGIHRGEDAEAARRANNDRSGVDRTADMKLFPLVRAWPGKLAIRAFDALQRCFLRTDAGSGYLLRATRQ